MLFIKIYRDRDCDRKILSEFTGTWIPVCCSSKYTETWIVTGKYYRNSPGPGSRSVNTVGSWPYTKFLCTNWSAFQQKKETEFSSAHRPIFCGHGEKTFKKIICEASKRIPIDKMHIFTPELTAEAMAVISDSKGRRSVDPSDPQIQIPLQPNYRRNHCNYQINMTRHRIRLGPSNSFSPLLDPFNAPLK